jgi:two-component system, sensor histidine kinase and response regulator
LAAVLNTLPEIAIVVDPVLGCRLSLTGVGETASRVVVNTIILIKPISPPDLLASIRLAIGVHTPARTVTLPTAEVSASSLSLRILLAEDNLVNQKVAMGMLGKMGHRITLAKNGLEALEQWRQSEFDLILMDVQMPEMNGLQATMQIRREETDAHVPIVAMTASAMSEERDRCLAAGMDDFISKPVSYRVLEQMIMATFSQRK